VNQDGTYLVEPFSLPGEGSLQGTLSVGSGAARSSNDFQVQVFPRRPAMPPWFAPVNLSIPFIILALILGFVTSRKVTFAEGDFIPLAGGCPQQLSLRIVGRQLPPRTGLSG